jgi:hypothetical protein
MSMQNWVYTFSEIHWVGGDKRIEKIESQFDELFKKNRTIEIYIA